MPPRRLERDGKTDGGDNGRAELPHAARQRKRLHHNGTPKSVLAAM